MQPFARRLRGKLRSVLCPSAPQPPRRGFLDAPGLRPDDIFLVSYPRSGNTWVRNIVAHMIYPAERITCLKDLDYLVPSLHSDVGLVDPDGAPVRLIKTHRSYPFRHERSNKALYRRNIYIVRHPYDTILSYYHYQLHLWGDAAEPSLETFVKKLVWGAVGPGSWQEHVLSWKVMENELDMLFIRYEDLRENTAAVVMQMAAFINLTISPEKMETILARSTRSAMVELEKAGSTVEAGFEFIRRQEQRRDMDRLSPAMKSLIWEHSRIAMEMFGYGPDHE